MYNLASKLFAPLFDPLTLAIRQINTRNQIASGVGGDFQVDISGLTADTLIAYSRKHGRRSHDSGRDAIFYSEGGGSAY